MPNDAYEHMKMLLNVNRNAKIVIECELRANVRFLALMNASSRYWSSIHANECVFSRNEQQKVYLSRKSCQIFHLHYQGKLVKETLLSLFSLLNTHPLPPASF